MKKGAGVNAAASGMFVRSLTFLGTSSGLPTGKRNVSGYTINWANGTHWLVDCGEGTQHQFLRCPEVSLSRVERILITHLHGDHCFGLPGLMCTLANLWAGGRGRSAATAAASFAAESAAAAAARPSDDDDEDDDAPPHDFEPFTASAEFLEIVGPMNLAAYLRSALSLSQSYFPFRYRVTELWGHVPPMLSDFTVDGSRDRGVAGSSSLPASFPPPPTPSSGDLACVQLHACEAAPRYLMPDRQSLLYEHIIVGDGCDSDQNTGGGGSVSLRAAPLTHRIFSIGYLVTEPSSPGTLDIAKALALGVPKGPLLSQLKNGAAVTFVTPPSKSVVEKAAAAGEPTPVSPSVTVRPEQVVGPITLGRTGVFLGDTCDSSLVRLFFDTPDSIFAPGSLGGIAPPGLMDVASDFPRLPTCDWLVHEATFSEATQHLAIPRGHSTAAMAARFAHNVRAKHLILTHFSARFAPRQKKDLPPPSQVVSIPVPLAATPSGSAASAAPAGAAKNASRAADEKSPSLGIEQLELEATATLKLLAGRDPTTVPLVTCAEDFLTIDLARRRGGA